MFLLPKTPKQSSAPDMTSSCRMILHCSSYMSSKSETFLMAIYKQLMVGRTRLNTVRGRAFDRLFGRLLSQPTVVAPNRRYFVGSSSG